MKLMAKAKDACHWLKICVTVKEVVTKMSELPEENLTYCDPPSECGECSESVPAGLETVKSDQNLTENLHTYQLAAFSLGRRASGGVDNQKVGKDADRPTRTDPPAAPPAPHGSPPLGLPFGLWLFFPEILIYAAGLVWLPIYFLLRFLNIL
jgi:hypothetical protein